MAAGAQQRRQSRGGGAAGGALRLAEGQAQALAVVEGAEPVLADPLHARRWLDEQAQEHNSVTINRERRELIC